MMPINIMYCNIEIAVKNGNWYEANEGIPQFMLPSCFRGRRTVEFYYVQSWIKDRIFPKERPDRDLLLKDMGLSNYNAFSICEQTHAGKYTDYWWCKYEETDSFTDWCFKAIFEKVIFRLENDNLIMEDYDEY